MQKDHKIRTEEVFPLGNVLRTGPWAIERRIGAFSPVTAEVDVEDKRLGMKMRVYVAMIGGQHGTGTRPGLGFGFSRVNIWGNRMAFKVPYLDVLAVPQESENAPTDAVKPFTEGAGLGISKCTAPIISVGAHAICAENFGRESWFTMLVVWR